MLDENIWSGGWWWKERKRRDGMHLGAASYS
jgi:hypothetical protein